MKKGDGFWGFIDWTDGLNKQSAIAGVYIYCAKKVQKIAEILGDAEKAEEMKKAAAARTEAAKKYLFDKESGLFNKRRGKTDQLCKSGMADPGRRGRQRRGNRNPGPSGGVKTGKRNGFSVHEPSFCGSTSDVRKKRRGNGIYEDYWAEY